MPALAQAAAMPLLEETTQPQEHPPTIPVVIIGKLFGPNFKISVYVVPHASVRPVLMLTHHLPYLGLLFRQWAIGYLSVLPAEWVQALPRFGNCPPKPNTIQETAGDQASTHH